ncbi:hypothetical protein LTR84_002789 [Exophiala bonariae]|uniref:Xylanolytic transcriptional activator regulatory domain-containing protein n=1 Tax=Exophiala bonariae TaxID=1690606 RepID=A0AAV9N8W6_9EURO|nr:hypothetical protein LTR84_002789 [Exophiala bonariae]
MDILGLPANFTRQLRHVERASSSPRLSSARLYMVTHQQALSALAAFSAHVHIWYPIFRPGFSEQYFRVISGPLIPSPESCLTLLVTAIGLVVHSSINNAGEAQSEHTSDPYFEAAIASLPLVLTDDSIASAQCLILLSIYYCCLCRPCHALDYCLIASIKVQNCLQNAANEDHETNERLIRAYWVVLLLESELRVQFSAPESGLWRLDDEISLPDSRTTWHFDIDTGSPGATATPSSMVSTTSASTDKVQSYFLAEIAMRRMLHRCNTAIRRTSDGKISYAPGIAVELELQLDEWHKYLPDLVRFEIEKDVAQSGSDTQLDGMDSSDSCPLSNFLRVQYHCCKISIYWPAIYQVINEGSHDNQLSDHCQRFWNSYIQLVPSIMAAFQECIVNRWTLYASIFMTTMAALKGSLSSCLQDTVDMTQLGQSFAMTRTAERRMIEISPSLTLLADTLAQKLAIESNSPSVVITSDVAEH